MSKERNAPKKQDKKPAKMDIFEKRRLKAQKKKDKG